MVSPQIHEHPDGTISVRVGSQVYSDTVQNFKKDFGGNFTKLPLGIHERIYEQGVRHSLIADNSVVDGGPVPWAAGDTVLGNLNDALEKKEQRLDKEAKRLKKLVDDDADDHRKKIKDDADKHLADVVDRETKQREAIDKRLKKEFEDKKKAGDQKEREREAEIEARKATIELERQEKLKENEIFMQPIPKDPPDGFRSWRERLDKKPPDDKSNQG